jgi:hypothetical protein
MTAPIVEGIHKVDGRSSVEVNNSCNNCFPCCFGRKIKHHKHGKQLTADIDRVLEIGQPIPRREGSLALHRDIIVQDPAHMSARYNDMPPVALPTAGINTALGNPEGTK